MEKLEGNVWGLNPQKCSFCCSPSGEIKLILKLVLRQLSKMLQDKKYADMLTGSEENNGALGRLMRVIFNQHKFQLKLSNGCSHLRLRNLIKEKLQCRSEQLETIMEDFCDRVARRHYELEIIASQVKNVENSISYLQEPFELQRSPQRNESEGEPSAKEESEIVQKKEEIQASRSGEREQALVKVEDCQDMQPQLLERSPQTGIPYTVSFGQMPYSYNFLFYGSYYQ